MPMPLEKIRRRATDSCSLKSEETVFSSDSPDAWRKSQPPIGAKLTGGKSKLKRAMTTGQLSDFPEEIIPPEPWVEGAFDFEALDEKLTFLIDITLKNMHYTKAIYATTKKSLNGPGYEVGMLSKISTFDRTSTVATGILTDASSMIKSATPASTTGLKRTGTNLDQADKINNMLELTQYILQQNKRKTRRAEIGGQVWRCMEDRTSGGIAAVYSILTHVMLAASVVMACVDVIGLDGDASQRPNSEGYFIKRRIAVAIESFFIIEIALRFACCPTPKVFWKNKYNIIDAVSTLPLIIRLVSLSGNSEEIEAFLCLVPVLRLCKLLRRFETFHLLASAFRSSIEALPVIIFTMMLICLTFTAFIYYVEPRSNVKSYGFAVWYVMVTMCGVSPGQPLPVTDAGKALTSILLLCSILYMAIPIGIVGSAFGHVWEERSRLLLMQRMRTCVERLGYTPTDLMAMFKVLDKNNDGTLDFEEFSAMLDVMQIGVEEQFIMEVFESFDADCEGTIDFRELLRGLFPHADPNTVELHSEDSVISLSHHRQSKNGRLSLQNGSSFRVARKGNSGDSAVLTMQKTNTGIRFSTDFSNVGSTGIAGVGRNNISLVSLSNQTNPAVLRTSISKSPKGRLSANSPPSPKKGAKLSQSLEDDIIRGII